MGKFPPKDQREGKVEWGSCPIEARPCQLAYGLWRLVYYSTCKGLLLYDLFFRFFEISFLDLVYINCHRDLI